MIRDGGQATCRRTTTPLLSAECQICQQSDLSLRAARDTGVNKKSTKCQQIVVFFHVDTSIVIIQLYDIITYNVFRRDAFMSKDKIEYQVVTMRIPKKMYAEYKEILKTEGKIVTYDVRNYMHEVIEKSKAKEQK